MLVLLSVFLLTIRSTAAAASVSWADYELKLSTVAPGNVLPAFGFLASQVEGGAISVPIGGGKVQPAPFTPADSAPHEIWDHASPDLHAPFLPYLLQDQWDCAREPTNVTSIVFEDERLRLNIMPHWNARVWSVYDKTMKRNWVFDNPAHQPANVAVLKAWTSGGIEWNWSPGAIGHSAFSESPAWVGVVRTPRGPVVRAWEYDRRNASVWSVDLFLEGGALFVHPRVTNTRAAPIQGYWWTCVADRASPTTRIITPAENTVDTSSGTQWASWPEFAMGDPNASFSGYKGRRLTDNSFIGAVTSGDFFMGPTDPDQHYIAYADASGFVGYHGHDAKINGTKFFTWGQNGAGRFMQDFLGGISGPAPIADDARVGDYAELQVGPAFTQMQTFDVATRFSWSEYFSATMGDPAVLLGDSYRAAVGAVNAWRAGPASGVNDTRLADVTAFLEGLEDAPVDEVLAVGSPWGAVELARRAAPGGAAGSAPWPQGYLFNASRDAAEAAPWLELVAGGAVGTFSPATLAAEPVSWQVSGEWLGLLRASAQAHGATWLHDLFAAVALAEMGGVEEPRALLNASLAKRPSAIAARCLAVLQTESAAARGHFAAAWGLALRAVGDPSRARLLTNLASEIVAFELQRQGEPAADAALRDFLAQLPAAGMPSLLRLDFVLVAQATVALSTGDWSAVEAILTAPGAAGCFPTLASARSVLMDLWNGAQVARAVSENGGRPLTPWEQRQLRVSKPVPRNIGCPYGGGDGYPDCTYW